jgi:hypothetical protein
MSELRRFEWTTSLIVCLLCFLLAVAFVVIGHWRSVGGLIAGSLLGIANMAWMVGTARHLLGHVPTARMLQIAAGIRFLTVACLFGIILIVSRVDPIGAVIGYCCFPLAAAAAGWWMWHEPQRVSA